MSEQPRFVYKLRGGPYDGKEITGSDQLWRTEFYHHDPYSQNSSALAVYGFQCYQFGAPSRVLNYWGSQPCDAKVARRRMPEFCSK